MICPLRLGVARSQSGSAAVELAIFVPIFVLLLVVASGIPIWLHQVIQLESAMRAGASFASLSIDNAFDTDGVEARVETFAGAQDITVTWACGCPDAAPPETLDDASNCPQRVFEDPDAIGCSGADRILYVNVAARFDGASPFALIRRIIDPITRDLWVRVQ